MKKQLFLSFVIGFACTVVLLFSLVVAPQVRGKELPAPQAGDEVTTTTTTTTVSPDGVTHKNISIVHDIYVTPAPTANLITCELAPNGTMMSRHAYIVGTGQ